MRQGSRDAAEDTLLQVYYVPNLEVVGWVWMAGETLVYEENPFARNRLGMQLKAWAKQWNVKADSSAFFRRLMMGDGWRWAVGISQDTPPVPT